MTRLAKYRRMLIPLSIIVLWVYSESTGFASEMLTGALILYFIYLTGYWQTVGELQDTMTTKEVEELQHELKVRQLQGIFRP